MMTLFRHSPSSWTTFPQLSAIALRSSVPLVDLCNAASVATAIPIAVLDLDRITGELQVRHATGAETYATFAGDDENPDPGEVVYADSAQQAHSRRWCNRQSRHADARVRVPDRRSTRTHPLDLAHVAG